MSRRFLVNRNVNQAGGVNPPIQPNIGQYGWTSSDAAHVNQLISYVDVAREYAERTQLHSDYVRDAMRDFIEPTLREIKVIHTHLVAANNGWTLKYEKFQEDYADFLNKYNVFQNDLGEFKTNLADINVKYVDIQQRHMDIRTKHAEVEENTKKVEDIYSEMKDGQVYRGIWNPEGASAYPNHENTNSSWDVVLRDDLDSVVFDNKTWQTGNRLIWIKTDNAYTQIKTTTQVTSVNGKSGAVTLTHSDVGAISTSGGTATGAIESPEFKAPLFGQYSQHTMFKSKNAHLKVTDGTTEYGVYSEANKPSAADVRALPISGGTTTGKITAPEIWTTNGGYMTAVGQSGSNVKIGSNSNIFISCPEGGSPYVCSNVHYDGGAWTKHNPTKPSGFLGVGAEDLTFYKSDASSSNPLQHRHVVYHTGNKPTAADVGAVGWRQVNATGNGVTYTRLASLPANVGSGSAGMTLLVSGGSNFGATYIPSFVVGFSTRGYTGSGAHPSGTVRPVCLTGSSEHVTFYAVTTGDTVELWMRRNIYSYTTAVALLQNNSGTLLVDQTVGSLPTGTVTEFAPILNYTTSNKPTAADVGALSLTGGLLQGTLDFGHNNALLSYNNLLLNVEAGVHTMISSGIVNPAGTTFIGTNFLFREGWSKPHVNSKSSVLEISGEGIAYMRSDPGQTSPVHSKYKVYHAGDKPTAADVGAVPLDGSVNFSVPNGGFQKSGAESLHTRFYGNRELHIDSEAGFQTHIGSNFAVSSTYYKRDNNAASSLIVIGATPDTLRAYYSAAGETNPLQNSYRIYSEGFKPTAADVGALPISGGTVQGDFICNGSVLSNNLKAASGRNLISASGTDLSSTVVGTKDGVSYLYARDGVLWVEDQASAGYRVYHEGFKPTTLDIQSVNEKTKEVSSLAEVITEMQLEIESLKSEINQLRSKQ